jgi:ATP-dependent DNA helicase DinG
VGEPARALDNVVAGPWVGKLIAPPSLPSLRDRTADVFARVLPTAWPGYAPRDGQMRLTSAIADAVEKGGQLLAEGPCGTGKGLAYLVPAIISADKTGRTVVIVTASIALQEQLVQHDLPRLAEALAGELNTPLTFTLLKGRGNYLCKHTMEEADPVYLSHDERAELATVDQWARTTETGDRLELPMIVRDGVWGLRSMSTDDCLRDGCDHYDTCFARKARAKAEGVRVLVINYHLLFAHISVRRETQQDIVLPKTAPADSMLAWDTVICDEAHEAGDIARDFLGCDLTERMVGRVAAWVRKDGEGRGPGVATERNQLAAQIERAASVLWGDMLTRVPMADRKGADRIHRLREGLDAEALVELLGKAESLAASLAGKMKRQLPDLDTDERKVMRRAENTARRARRTGSWLDASVCPAEAPDTVLWLEVHTSKKGHESATLHGRLLDVGEVLRREFFDRSRAVILTSATLTTGAVPRINTLGPADGSDAWGWIRAQLGLPGITNSIAVASPFDFAAQSILCLPTHPAPMPSPTGSTREAFDARVCEVLADVARSAGGRTLGLFTSTRMARRAAEHLRALGLPYPVLCQGEHPRPHLLAAMRAQPSILCGTASLWTGVDLPGEAVVAVVIDKMPFPPPDDPVMQALSELAFARTGDQWSGWRQESLPRATLALRQGVGRLIRSTSDWGAVVLCDPRLVTARYGSGVVRSLAMPAQVRSVAAAGQWFAARAGKAAGR